MPGDVCESGVYLFVHLLTYFATSTQKRLQIPSFALDSHKIIQQEDPVIYTLMEDMGGFGRPLEALEEALAMIPDLNNFDVDRLLGSIVDKMATKYPDMVEHTNELIPTVLHIFMRRRVLRDEKLVRETKGDLTAKRVVEMGLFEYNTVKCTLNCPFVLLCLLCQWSNDKTLAHLNLPVYNRLKENTDDIPCTGQFWPDWEELLAQFHVLKSKLYGSAESIKYSDLHTGAFFGERGTVVLVKEEHATGIFHALHIVLNDQGTILTRESSLIY